ncbi:MAG: DUF177 domain-containing protein [Oscillospiraceae bacterium]|nr:DUF177 domain-containing protein [Oscillospiraceae bacterium]
MLLRLRQVFDREGDKKDIHLDIPLEELGVFNGVGTFCTPLSLRGSVCNRAGVVSLNYTVSATISHICDRCLNEFNREYSLELEHILVRSTSSQNDEYVVCQDDTLDLNELAITDLLISMPTKILCDENCKGLCVGCGANLNVSPCKCNS